MNWIDEVIAFGKRIDDDNPIGALAGIPVVQSRYVPKGFAMILNGKLITHSQEKPVATSTAQTRVRVYGGPLHGRILLIPANSPRFVTLPYPMPAGEMWGKGRTRPQDFEKGEYTYEVKSGVSIDGKYLGFVESHARTFSIPVVTPSIRITTNGINLVRNLREASFNYGDERVEKSNSTAMNTLYGKLTATEKALVEYIASLEAHIGKYRDQTVRY